jgi:hypothetical protein
MTNKPRLLSFSAGGQTVHFAPFKQGQRPRLSMKVGGETKYVDLATDEEPATMLARTPVEEPKRRVPEVVLVHTGGRDEFKLFVDGLFKSVGSAETINDAGLQLGDTFRIEYPADNCQQTVRVRSRDEKVAGVSPVVSSGKLNDEATP